MGNVSLHEVRKSFGKTEVIHGISCDIPDGEFVVILGPSGCGKSTVLRLIAGLETVTSGEVAIDGQVVNQLEPADRDIAMVFQNYALYPHMTVYKNMAYGLQIRGMAKADIEERVQTAAGILELTDLLNRKPRELSGGQRQRVAMGRCIVREPKVFLFDEPLSNLDAKLRVQMRLEIRKLHESLRTTSIYVTHDQVEAMTLADRLIVMNDGHTAQIGAPLELYERPETLFVAGFIGSSAMNFFDARLSEDGGAAAIAGADPLRLNGIMAEKNGGRDVTLGVRPEHLHLAREGSAAIRLKVEYLEVLGADTLVHGHFGSEKTLITARIPGIHHFSKNENLSLVVSPEKLHLFDRISGQRIVG